MGPPSSSPTSPSCSPQRTRRVSNHRSAVRPPITSTFQSSPPPCTVSSNSIIGRINRTFAPAAGQTSRQPNRPPSRPLSRAGSFDSSPHSPLLQPGLTTNSTLNNAQQAQQPIGTLFDPLPSLPSRLRQATLKLVPPPNFGFVDGALYRAGEPDELSFEFLDRLALKTLVWLAPRPPSVAFRRFLDHSRIAFCDLGIQHAASLDAVTEEAVTLALRIILNPTVYPLMIMCGGGSHRTGTVVGCLRKLQGWNLASIFEEYRRYAGAQHHIMNEQFIEFYDVQRLVVNGFCSEDGAVEEAWMGKASGLSGGGVVAETGDRPDQVAIQRATPSSAL